MIRNLGNSSEWPKVKELKTDKVLIKEDEYISVVCFSVADNGSYVAGGTTKGNIFIWHVNTGDLILETKSTSEHEYSITAIDWSPKSGCELAFIDCNGYWGVLDGIPIISRGNAKADGIIMKEKKHLLVMVLIYLFHG